MTGRSAPASKGKEEGIKEASREEKGREAKRVEKEERREVMKIALVTLLFAASTFAQVAPPTPPAACGPPNVSFKVKLEETQHTLTPPDPGKARVYFLQDAGTGRTLGYPTVKLAIRRRMGRREPWQLLFLGFRRAGRASCVRHVAVVSGGAARGTSAFHGGGGQSLLLPHTADYVAGRGVVGARSD